MRRIIGKARFKRAHSFILGCVVLLLAACGPKKGVESPSGKRTVQYEKKLKEQGVTDSSIRAAVEREIIFDQALKLNRIDVQVSDAIVTLDGKVTNVLAKRRAADIAETVRGVRAVVNKINVEPMEYLSDTAIRENVSQALVQDPATRRYRLDVEVDDHVVILKGNVGSYQQSLLAEKVASYVRGVKEVKNEINVTYKEDRSDEQIKAEVEKTLEWNALVDDELIDVNVDNGRVKLLGKVGSLAEKSVASIDAWVQGVKDVVTDNLEVVDWASDERTRESQYVIKPDSEIRSAVEDALLYDPRVFGFKISPSVDTGVVTLRGIVDNLKAKQAAEQTAENTVGVVDVKNRIKVDASTPSDEEIEDHIGTAIERDPYLKTSDIDFDVTGGIVVLNGIVDTYYEKGRAQDLASRTYGVLEIVNNLKVVHATRPLVNDPYVDDYRVYGTKWYNYEPATTYLADNKIHTEIIYELWWSPFVDMEDINVRVEDGVVTLRGKVNTLKEWRAAREEAYEGGAVWVRNKINIVSPKKE